MRVSQFILTATPLIVLPVIASAQTAQTSPSTIAPLVEQQSTTGQSQPTTSPPSNTGATSQGDGNQWMASGFAGSNFGNNADPASTVFGGSVGYLVNSRFGAEFDASFAPNFELQNNFFGIGETPMINTYMANAVAVMPFGPDAKWQPFIAGGIGAISLRSDIASSDAAGNQFGPNASRFGGDIGGGLMGFLGNWGFKADLQYFRARGSYNTTPSNLFYTPGASPSQTTTGPTAGGTPGVTTPSPTPSPSPTPVPVGPYVARDTSSSSSGPSGLADTVLSGLHFWRANIGVALRW